MNDSKRKQEIGLFVKQKRLSLKLSQSELAEKVGYSTRGAINKIEKGINDIPYKKMELFASVLDCSINDLIPLNGMYQCTLETMARESKQAEQTNFNRLADLIGYQTLLNLSNAVSDINNYDMNDYLTLLQTLSDKDVKMIGALIEKIIKLQNKDL